MHLRSTLPASFALTAALLAMGGCAASTEDAPSTPASASRAAPSDPLAIRADDAPLVARRIAEAHLETVRGSAAAPKWSSGARLARDAHPLFRPDLDGPAYFEFEVTQGGFIVVASGPHDAPIAHWSDEGEPMSRALVAQAEAEGHVAARLFKLDALAYAAEDASEELAAEIGARVLHKPNGTLVGDDGADWPTWRAAKRDYARAFAPSLAHLHESAIPDWREARDTGTLAPQSDEFKNGLATVNASQTYWVESEGLLKTSIRFKQEDIGSCHSGCGPVAWAQVTAYIDRLAERGSAYYRDALGAQRLYSGGLSWGDDARGLVASIRSRLGTFCVGDLGSTTTWGMNRWDDWAQSKGANIKLATDSFWDQEDHAERWLKERKPVVVGTGTYQHYAVGAGLAYVKTRVTLPRVGSGGGVGGFGTTTINVTKKYIWVNQGWGGTGNGWIPLSVFYAATPVKRMEADRAAQVVRLKGLAGKCMEVAGGFTTSGTPVQLYDCNGTASQVWTLLPNGELRGLANKCLDVRGGNTANGTPLQLWDCNGTESQHFQIDARGEMRGLGDKCVEVKGGFTANRTPVQLYDCNGTASQVWARE